MSLDTNKQISIESFDNAIFSSLTYECPQDDSSPDIKPSKDPEKLFDFMNKRKGRKMSRYIKNKSRKVSNVGYPIHIEDDETK
jgi:hypothetical protein